MSRPSAQLLYQFDQHRLPGPTGRRHRSLRACLETRLRANVECRQEILWYRSTGSAPLHRRFARRRFECFEQAILRSRCDSQIRMRGLFEVHLVGESSQ